jgi:hypothetical protein
LTVADRLPIAKCMARFGLARRRRRGVILIEPAGAVKENPCANCGGTNRLLLGYAYEDGYAYGVYFVEWCDGQHPHRSAFFTIGLGSWGDGTDATDRMSFGIEWRAAGMRLTDEPARDDLQLLGAFTPRDGALQLSNIEQLWHVVDHIVTDDPRVGIVQDWLNAT